MEFNTYLLYIRCKKGDVYKYITENGIQQLGPLSGIYSIITSFTIVTNGICLLGSLNR